MLLVVVVVVVANICADRHWYGSTQTRVLNELNKIEWASTKLIKGALPFPNTHTRDTGSGPVTHGNYLYIYVPKI